MATKAEFIDKICEYGVYVWLFLLPWQTRYFLVSGTINDTFWEYGSKVVYATELLLVVLLGVRFFLWCKRREWQKLKKSKHWYTSVPVVLAIFFVYTTLSLLWSDNASLSWYYVVKLCLAGGAFWLMVSTKVKSDRMMTALVAAGVVQGLLAVSQFTNQFIPAVKWLGIAEQDAKVPGAAVVESVLSRWLRGYGSLPHPNILGGFMTVLMVFVWELYVLARQRMRKLPSNLFKWYRPGLLFATVFIVTGLVLSFSRAAWLGLAFCLFGVIVSIFTKLHRERKSSLLSFLVVVGLAAALWPVIFSEPFLVRVKGNEVLELRSNQERLESLVGAKDVIRDNWVFGTGLGTYTWSLYQKTSQYPAWFYQPVHNVYLLVMSELGIVGLMLFLWLVGLVLYYSRKPWSWLVLGLMLFMWLFDHWWWSLQFGWYFIFLVFGFVYKQRQIDETHAR